MHPQLQAIADEFRAARDRPHRLVAVLPAEVWARRADPLDRLWTISPFDARIRYNGYACLTILSRHEHHRHLWQAERVWATQDKALAGRRGAA